MHEEDGDRDEHHHDRVDHRADDPLAQALGLLHEAREAREDHVEHAARLARLHHVHVEVVEDPGVLGQRVGERRARLSTSSVTDPTSRT